MPAPEAAEENIAVYVCGHLADINAHAEHSALERKSRHTHSGTLMSASEPKRIQT
jgi:hypothetical protein